MVVRGVGGALAEIVVYTCKKCLKKDDYVNNENICFDCVQDP